MKSAYTFAVALPRFRKRFNHIKLQLESKIRDRYEIVGVDGRELEFLSAPILDFASENMSEGQAGCALSHIKAYHRMAQLDLPHAFIIEDDAIIPTDIDQIIESCLPHLSSRGVISFYSPRPTPSKFSLRNAPKLMSGQLLAPTARLDVHTATAYLIGREAAIGILAVQSPLKHLADHWFAFHAGGAIDRVLLHYPMPVSVAHFDSSLGYDKGLRKTLKSIVVAFPPTRSALKRKREATENQQKANIIVVDEPSFYDREGE